MAVGAEYVFIVYALGLVLAVVAVTGQHGAQGLYAAAQPGLAAVVFKAHYHAAAGVRAALELIIADHAGL